MKTQKLLNLLVLPAALALGCAGSSPQTDTSGPSGAKPSAPTFESQVASGAALYGANCASCHGDGGEGTARAPAVVGTGVLPLDPPAGAKHRDVQFRTALDVFMWVKKTMPADDPGSLTDEEYIAILAFDLKANGVELKTALDGQVAAALVLNK